MNGEYVEPLNFHKFSVINLLINLYFVLLHIVHLVVPDNKMAIRAFFAVSLA